MTYLIKKNKYFSPLLFFIISWFFVYILYTLYWSELLPKMIPEVSLFIFVTVLISLIFFVFTPKLSFTFELNLYKEFQSLKIIFIFTLFLFLIEVIFCKGFPLLDIFLKTFKYTEFGLPIFHVLYFSISSIYCAKSFLLFCLSRHKKFLWYTFLFFTPGILVMTRSYLMYNMLYVFIIYLSVIFVQYSLRKKIKIVLFFCIFAFVGIYLFGLLGNIRSNASYGGSGSSYINDIAKPSESFGDKNPILLWFYCYVTTPLGNLINTINNPIESPLSEISDLNAFFYHFLPDIIKKRIFLTTKSVNLVVPYFNVSSIYATVYVPLGYLGMIYSFLGTLIIVYCTYRLKRNNLFSFLSFVFLSTIIFFNMFTNMFNFMGLAPQFWISLLFTFSKDLKSFLIKGNNL